MIITLLVSKAALLLQWKEYGQRNNYLIVKVPINIPQGFGSRIFLKKCLWMEINEEEVHVQYEEDSNRDGDKA